MTRPEGAKDYQHEPRQMEGQNEGCNQGHTSCNLASSYRARVRCTTPEYWNGIAPRTFFGLAVGSSPTLPLPKFGLLLDRRCSTRDRRGIRDNLHTMLSRSLVSLPLHNASLWALAACVAAASAEGVLSGTGIKARFAELRLPNGAPG